MMNDLLSKYNFDLASLINRIPYDISFAPCDEINKDIDSVEMAIRSLISYYRNEQALIVRPYYNGVKYDLYLQSDLFKSILVDSQGRALHHPDMRIILTTFRELHDTIDWNNDLKIKTVIYEISMWPLSKLGLNIHKSLRSGFSVYDDDFLPVRQHDNIKEYDLVANIKNSTRFNRYKILSEQYRIEELKKQFDAVEIISYEKILAIPMRLYELYPAEDIERYSDMIYGKDYYEFEICKIIKVVFQDGVEDFLEHVTDHATKLLIYKHTKSNPIIARREIAYNSINIDYITSDIQNYLSSFENDFRIGGVVIEPFAKPHKDTTAICVPGYVIRNLYQIQFDYGLEFVNNSLDQIMMAKNRLDMTNITSLQYKHSCNMLRTRMSEIARNSKEFVKIRNTLRNIKKHKDKLSLSIY